LDATAKEKEGSLLVESSTRAFGARVHRGPNAVERVELPAGKSQVYLYDTEQPGLALSFPASGG